MKDFLSFFFSENRETRSFMIEHERGTQADCEDIILPYYLQINVSRVKERNAGRSEENHNPEQ